MVILVSFFGEVTSYTDISQWRIYGGGGGLGGLNPPPPPWAAKKKKKINVHRKTPS